MKSKITGKKLAVADQFSVERDYWLQKLAGELVLSRFPADFANTVAERKMHSYRFEIEDVLTERLLKMSKGNDYTLHVILLAGFLILLERFTDNRDLIVGMPVYKQEVEGEYINTVLTLRNQLEAGMTVKDLLLLVKQTTIEAVEHQNYPLETLAYKLCLPESGNGAYLFDTAVLLETIHEKRYIEDLKLNTVLSFTRVEERIQGSFEYNSLLYPQEMVERIVRYYLSILHTAVFQLDLPIDQIEMFSEAEKQQLIFGFNQTGIDRPAGATIISLFEKQVQRSQDSIALISNHQKMTYAELSQKVNQLATKLKTYGIKKDEIVGLMIERSVEMIVGMLAIMKAGGAYLPLDYTYPNDRIQYMIADSQMRLLLVSDAICTIDGYSINLLNINDPVIYESESGSVESATTPDHLAYMIYTSGSTGNPKGVMVEHYSIVNTLLWRSKYYGFDQNDTILQLPSYAFDSSVEDIFTALISGARLVLIEQKNYFDLNYLQELIIENQVTHFLIVPNFYRALLNGIPDSLQNLRVVTVAGEDFTEEMVTEHFTKLPKVRLCNEYGPTENSVCTTVYEFTSGKRKVLIGKPIDNVSCYILDNLGHLAPVGVPGELCVSGRGVVRGYYRRAELTDEKFVKNPLVSGQRMYKTGDLACWTVDGELEFLGRKDHQIKIRGFRIELGEIENKLLQYAQVKEAVVIAADTGKREKTLIAYVVLDQKPETEQLMISCLKDYLANHLPDYMIPQYIVLLEQMPLLPNGKINKRALPEPVLTEDVEYISPRDEVEAALVRIWGEVLEMNHEEIGINHDFFEMGGHSLKATTFVAKLYKQMGIKIHLSEVFEASTIKEMANLIRKKEKVSYSSIMPVEAREYYPLSSAQMRLFILEQFDSIATTYNVPMAMLVQGKIDYQKLESAFRRFIARHEALRTSFKLVDDTPVQYIAGNVDFTIDFVSSDGPVNIEEQMQDFVRPFDLSKAPLLRVKLMQLPSRSEEGLLEHVLMIDMHHIITDGVSMNILIQELIALYQNQQLTDLRIQYKDFAVWQNQLFSSETIHAQERYWLEQFCDEIPVLNLPTDGPKPAVRSFQGDSMMMTMGKELLADLYRLTQKTDTTLFMVLLASYNVLLAKYSGQEDIIVGAPIAGRSDIDLQNIMGVFINTLALRNYPVVEKSFVEFLAEVKERSVKAFENQDYQFEMLVEKLDLRRDLSKNPLFDVMFVLQNTGHASVEVNEVTFIPCEFKNNKAKFDLTLTAVEENQELSVNFEYSTTLFKEETIRRMQQHFAKILKEITSNPEIRLADIQLLGKEEKQKLLVEFNDTGVVYPKEKTIHQLFEEQVQKAPENIALVAGQSTITYAELNARANQLARDLRRRGVKPDQAVGIMMDRSVEMVTGVLAIIKAGGAYLPVESDYPVSRIRFMLEDGDVNVLLTTETILGTVGRAEISDLCELIDLRDEKLYFGDSTNLENVNTANDLIYIIYTSGSTGKPKGVMIEHMNVNRLISHSTMLKVTEEDRLMPTGPLAFDASTFELWGPLLNGARMYLVSKDELLSARLVKNYLYEYNVSMIWLTAPLFNNLFDEDPTLFANLRTIVVGGDVVSAKRITGLRAQYPHLQVINGYGPTENTTFSTYCEIDREYLHTIPIGRPVSNTRVYVVDREQNLQPVGIPGELWVAGDGVARGYLKQDELTKEKFLTDPFTHTGRVYRTGDLARWLADGQLEFLGRIDQQVKIRGFRIEPDEIVAHLLQIHGIEKAVVVPGKGAIHNSLLAYFVANSEMSVNWIRAELSKALPNYMIPSYFIQLEALPLMSNGKIDLLALPGPDQNISTGKEYIAPRTELEERLATIFATVLGVERVGVNDDFFALGGHSLKVTKLAATMYKEFGVEIPLRQVFKTPTIQEIAEYIQNAAQSVYQEIQPALELSSLFGRELPAGHYLASSAQKRLFILNQLEPTNIGYNMVNGILIEGELDRERLEKVFAQLIRRHESLRTSFHLFHGDNSAHQSAVLQKIHQDVDFTMEYQIVDVTPDETEAILQGFVRPFDLSQPPLLRVRLIKPVQDATHPVSRHILLFDMHHIISDGISMNILIKDVIALYQNQELAGLRIQYKDYSVWQNELIDSGTMRAQEEYWLNQFNREANEIPVINIPTDYPRPATKTYRGDSIDFTMDRELTDRLTALARRTGATTYMVLLAALNALLSKYTDQEDIIVGSPVAGRVHPDLENIMGMFVNTLAMRNYPVWEKTFDVFLAEVKNTALKGYENQDYQFEMLVDKLALARNLNRNPLFDVMFALQNLDQRISIHEDLRFAQYPIKTRNAKFDLTLTGYEAEYGIGFNLEYSTELFTQETIRRFAEHFINIIQVITTDPTIRLADITMLSEQEKERLLIQFNDTVAAFPEELTVHQLFEEQAMKNPERVAVVMGEQEWTYQELNQRANQLARLLREKGVQREQVVAIMLKPSFEMLLGILAVLKAGGAYLPIDREYPKARVEYILQDAQPVLVLTSSDGKVEAESGQTVLALDELNLDAYSVENLESINHPDDLIYVIYTSGSTGQPKGTLITHSGVVNYVWWAMKSYLKGEPAVFPLYTSLSFDLTVTSIFVPLVSGNQVIIYHDSEKELLIETIVKENRVDIIKITPAHLRILSMLDLSGSRIKRLIVGGEILTTDLTRAVYDKFNGRVEIYNEYGPTETIVGCMIHQYDPAETGRSSVPIGVPADNVQIYLLDRYQNPVGMNMYGEIFISGAGVGQGYLHQEALTAERFVENPFIPGKIMYRTGDLARFIEPGIIEFIGRMDDQVKIRGYRIEPAEIEKELLAYPGIHDAVILDCKDQSGTSYLSAYLVVDTHICENGFDLELREYLSKKLPEYMIPTRFIPIEQVPLTTNGKVDKQALLAIQHIDSAEKYVAATNVVEENLMRIWSEILGIEQIGIYDDFFRLGGHSLSATSLVYTILKEMKVKMTLSQIFQNPTIKAQAEFIARAEESIYSSIEPVQESKTDSAGNHLYVQSSAQRRLYMLNQIERTGLSYNMPGIMIIEGDLDVEQLEAAFKKIIQRHETLRTSFDLLEEEAGPVPVQRIHPEVDFRIDYRLESTGGKELDEIINAHVEEFIQPFDMSKAPLLRVRLVKLPENQRHLFLFDMHHIISDGISVNIFVQEVGAFYAGKELPELRIQYKDFAAWQNQLFASGKFKTQEVYWLQQFAKPQTGKLPVLTLPTDYPRPGVKTFAGDHVRVVLEKDLTAKVKEFALDNGVTLYMVLLAAYNIMLAKYAHQEDIIIGSTMAGRPHADLEKMIGIFINTVAMRNHLVGDKKCSEFLQEVKTQVLNASENQDYPFEMLVAKLEAQGNLLSRDLSRTPLFDVMLVLQNQESPELVLDNLKFISYSGKKITSKYDLTLYANEFDQELALVFNYSTELFRRETIETFAGQFCHIIEGMITNPEIRIGKLTGYSPEAEIAQIADFTGSIKIEGLMDESIQDLFYQAVDGNPDQPAIQYGSTSITYHSLDCNSNAVANTLIERGGVQKKVGIFTGDRANLITVMLGVLKARAVFVPLDLAYPAKRLGNFIQLADCDFIYTDCANEPGLNEILSVQEHRAEIIVLDQQHSVDIRRPQLKSLSDDPLYIYFTSGSTGEPKGIVGRYESLIHFIKWEVAEFDLDRTCRISQLSSPAFDAFLRDVFVPLIAGGTICIPESRDGILDANKLADWIEDEQIQLIHCVPSIFKLFSLTSLSPDRLTALKYVLLSGERIHPGLVRDWYQIFGERIQLVNLYGPTETTMVKTFYRIRPEDGLRREISIGQPIPGSQLLILDDEFGICGSGVTGNIYIRTLYGTLGYYNDRHLTEQAFIQNPFSQVAGDLLYKTGDQGRLQADGNYEFIGRRDKQVKIRGVRVQVKEIEDHLLSHPDLKKVVVVSLEDDQKEPYLCGYLVAEQQLSVAELRSYLAERLPEYMIPAYFMYLEEIPLTVSGKVDHKALPKPDGQMDTGVKYVAPTNELEERLALIWSQLLHAEKVGIYDNFFELGGHSLKATALVSKVLKELDVAISLRDVFTHQTIKDLAEVIQSAARSKYTGIQSVTKSLQLADSHGTQDAGIVGVYPVSSAQKRLFILNQFGTKTTNYNMPRVLTIEGELNLLRLEAAFQQLIARHESLRTSFEFLADKGMDAPVQIIHQNVDFAIDYQVMDSTAVQIEEVVSAFVQPFDLSKAPLLRVGVIKLTDAAVPSEERHIFILDMHHIISDEISINIIIQEVLAFYQGRTLPERKIQYKDFAVWQNAFFVSEQMKTQEEYWIGQFVDQQSDEIPVLDLPTDFSRPLVRDFAGDRVSFVIDEELTREIYHLMRNHDTTLYMTLLAAFNVLLAKYTGQDDIILGSPIAGRAHPDVEHIVGMFVNTLVMRNKPGSAKPFTEFLAEVKANSLAAYEHQDYPFEMLVEKLDSYGNLLSRDLGRNPLFDVMFILQNMDTSAMELDHVRFTPYPVEQKKVKFDLVLNLSGSDGKLYGSLEYSTQLFTRAKIERMARHFVEVLKATTANPQIQLADIEVLTDREKEQLLTQLHQTTRFDAGEQTIYQLFEEQVERTPDQIALIVAEQRITYGELNAKANQLARTLREKGVKRNQFVGILLDNSFEMAIAIFAIVKAGGAYLPVDPTYPEERIAYILNDSKATLLLSKAELVSTTGYTGEWIDITGAELWQGDSGNLEGVNQLEDVAYLIYTSGSTGQPKGIMIEHRSLTNMILWRRAEYKFDSSDVLLQLFSYAFDGFVSTFFTPIVSGSAVVLLTSEEMKDPLMIVKCLMNHGVTHFTTVPALYSAVLEYMDPDTAYLLRSVTLAGDQVTSELVEKSREIVGDLEIINEYGPTENTVVTTIQRNLQNEATITIGRPITNTQVYVLNQDNNLAPVGVPGELCIAGTGLAKGYLNQPEMSPEAFISAPFAPGLRLYKSKDRVKWTEDGKLEFLGRMDNQVKIRGFRVELDEIESQLLQHERIENVVVTVVEVDSMKSLVAYYVAEEELYIEDLRTYLTGKLPQYMIPGYFMHVAAIPLTPNGKIDKKALPRPEITRNRLKSGYVAPGDEIEKEIASIFSEVLRVEPVGVHDSVFDLGGNSLHVIQISSRLTKKFEKEITAVTIFTYPTIQTLAGFIKETAAYEAMDRSSQLQRGKDKLSKMKKVRGR